MLKYFFPSLFALACFSSLMAELDYPVFPFDCAISGGWRRDNLASGETALSSAGSALWSDSLRAKGLNVWQYGIKARTTLSGLSFYQRSYFLDNAYFRGSAYRGTIKGGTFREGPLSHFVSSSSFTYPSSGSSVSSISSSSSSSSSFSSSSSSFSSSELERQSIHHGSTLDADIGFGFNFPVFWWFNFAPVAGYSFNKQKVRMHEDHIREAYTTKWKGPFAGVDISSEFCTFRFRGGYEFHWGEWHGFMEIKPHKRAHHLYFHPYRDRRNANGIQGHVGWLDLRYAWTEQFDLGVGIKYSFFQVARGRIVERDSHSLSSSERISLRKITWRSLGLMGEFVYRF